MFGAVNLLALMHTLDKLSWLHFYVQINFFQDHTKVILCPLMAAVTYIDDQRVVRTYRLPLIEKFGCSKELSSRLAYARAMCERMAASRSGSGALQTAPSTTTTATASASWSSRRDCVCA